MFRTRAYLTNMYLACFDLALTTSCYIAVEWWEFRSIGIPFGRGVLFTREHTLTLALVLAVWGSRTVAIIGGHEHADTPCGRGTPYGRLLEYDGKILLAGVPANTMTFCYFVAAELEPQLAIPVFTREKYPMRWRDADGAVRVSNMRLFSLHLDHDLRPLVGELKRRRQWREGRVGSLRLMLLRAREVYDAAVALADRGMFLRERPVR